MKPKHSLLVPRHPVPAAPIYSPVAQVWEANLYDDPAAPPSQQAIDLGRQLADTLAEAQGIYVSDHRAGVISFVSVGVERLLGYPAAEFAATLFDLIHPDDRRIVTEATVLVNEFVAWHLGTAPAGVVFTIDYRLRHARGHWVRVLRHNFALTWEARGTLVGAAAVLTDITQHKLTNDVRFHMNQPGFVPFVRQRQLEQLPLALSPREKEVALLVLEGLGSRAIAAQLGLSRETVSTHRRNFRRKVGSHDLYRLLRHLEPDDVLPRQAWPALPGPGNQGG